MKVRSIDIDRMPGVEDLRLDGLGDGITVVTGANESGKSSLVRALRALLWGHESDDGRPWDVAADVEVADGVRHVVREGGHTRWSRPDGVEADALPTPDGRYAGCFTIEVDELGVRGDGSPDELARQLRTELNGGVDVAAARAALADRTPTGVAEVKALRAARSEYVAARAHQREVEGARQRLADLVAERDALHAASRRHGLLEQVLAWRSAGIDLAQAEAELEHLPVGQLAQVRPSDRADFTRILEARDDADRGARECGTKLARLDTAIEQAMLSAPVPRVRLEELAGRVAQLERAQAEQERLARAHEAAHASHLAAVRELAHDVVEAAPATSSQVAIPDSDLELARRIAAEHAALDAAEAAHGRAVPEPLRSDGERAEGTSHAAARTAIVATGVFGVIAAAWLAISVHMAGWGVLVLVAACAAVATRSLARPTVDDRQEARVEARAAERQRAVQQQQLDEQRARLARRGDELAVRLGIRIEREPGAFADWLHRVARMREAAIEVEGARAALAGHERDHAGLLEQLERDLDGAGNEIRDAASARAALNAIERESAALATALEERPSAIESLESARGSAQRAREHRAAFLEARGLDPELDDVAALAELDALASKEPAYRALVERRTGAEAAVRAAAARIPAAEQERYRDLDLEAIGEELRLARQADQQHIELVERITEASGAVARASGGSELTDALAARDETRAELEARRDEALRAQAAAFLVDWAASTYARDNAPPIVADANRMLAAATGGRYGLTVAGGQVAARDASRTRDPIRRLDQLSSGTRAQLLIATRVAFARQAERGERLPIFVDEALTTTDPDRFDAVVSSLAEIAREDDRQVVYLTSNPSDAGRVQRVLLERGHDAATQLTIGPDWDPEAANSLDVAPRTTVLAPDPGEAPSAWAGRIGVRRLDPHAGADAAHVWHLHEPDLALVHRLLDQRITTLGSARSLDRDGLLAATCTPAELARMRATWRAWDAFVAAWQPGRGRRLEREDDLRAVLERAGIAASWLAKLWPFVADAAGDPRAIDEMWELPAGVRGFSRSSATEEKLRAQLLTDGFLPSSERLDDARILASVRTALGTEAVAADIDIDDRVHAWLHRAAAGTLEE